MAGEVNPVYPAATPLLDMAKSPIHDALIAYSAMTGDQVIFDPDAASSLERTPEKPYYAESVSAVTHLGEAAGELTVVAFTTPYNSTGAPSPHGVYEIEDKSLPLKSATIPRQRADVHSEVHLTIAATLAERPSPGDAADTGLPAGERSKFVPVMFAGNLDMVVGDPLSGDTIRTKGRLGQDPKDFAQAMWRRDASPTATLTVGNWSELHESGRDIRMGDPYAALNRYEKIAQIAGFVSLRPEAAEKHLDMIRLLLGPDLT